jgi:3-oxoacyl-[acyl-carrier-protein] synthase III
MGQSIREAGEPTGPCGAHLSQISAAVGAPCPVSELSEVKSGERSAELSSELPVYRRSEEPASVLGLNAARQTMSRVASQPNWVVYCTESLEDEPPSDVLAGLLVDLGLPGTPAMIVNGHGCANLGLSLQVASRLVSSEPDGAALLILGDKAVDDERLLHNEASVLSDGAAACWVGRDASTPGFEVMGFGFATQADANLRTTEVAMARQSVVLVNQAVANLLKNARVELQHFTRILVSNYREGPRMLLAYAAGFRRETVMAANTAQFGHCFAADHLMTLGLPQSVDSLRNGESILVLATGPRTCSAIGLRHRA